MSGKPTAGEIDQRVREVKEMLLICEPRSEIVRYAAKSWGVASRMVDEYISRARVEMQELCNETFKEKYMLVVSNFWKVYKRAIRDGNICEQRNCLANLAKIFGLELAPAEQAPRLELPDHELDKVIEQESVVH